MLGGLVHGAVGWPIFAMWTSILGAWLVLVHRNDPLGVRAWRACHTMWGRVLWTLNPMWSLDRQGDENLPDGPCILVCNHPSQVDIPAMFSVPRHVVVVASRRLWTAPIIGTFMPYSRQIRADRFFEEAPAALQSGVSIVVFAEGGRSQNGEVGRLRRGAFRVSREQGIPIVPVAISGSDKALANGARIPGQLYVRVKVRLLPAVSPADYASEAEMVAHVRSRIVNARKAL